MKRLKYIVVFALLFFIPVVANAKVNVYLFEGEGCPHCAEAKKFFSELKDDSSYSNKFDLVEYEVWYDTNNYELMENVAEELKANVSGVPFIVVGSDYYIGYASSMDRKLKDAIIANNQNSDYEDVVERVKNNGVTKKEVKSNPDIETNKPKEVKSESKGFFDKLIDDIDKFFNSEDYYIEGFGYFSLFYALLIVFLPLLILLFVYNTIILWKVFKKAGRKGWASIIPFYNRWVLYEISGYKGAYSLFILIPIAGLIIALIYDILAAISLAKKFKKEGAFHVLLWLLPIIGYSILAFGKASYDNSLGENKK